MAESTVVVVRSSQVTAAAERGMLLFPNKTDGSEEHTLTGKTNKELKDMCRNYGLAIGGNKTQLKARLQSFSEKFCNDPASCSLEPVKRRSHKGPRDGPKNSNTQRQKLSATRRAAMIDTERVTERSKDNRTQDEIRSFLAWADRSVARLPYVPPKSDDEEGAAFVPEPPSQDSKDTLGERMQMIETQLAALAAVSGGMNTLINLTPTSSSIGMFSAYSTPPMDYVIYDHAAQSTCASYPDNLSSDVLTGVDWSYTAAPQSLHVGNTAMTSLASMLVPDTLASTISTFCAPAGQSFSPSTSASSSVVPPSGPPIPTTTATESFTLGNGVTITLMINEIERLSVPAISFAQDIDRLNEMWDDTSPHWKGHSIFQIGGRSIALIHLPKFFKKTSNWSAHKSNWTEWKFLVERYRQGTPEEFWKDFRTREGSKMSYTAILGSLRAARKDSDIELAERARREYGAAFETTFRYRKSGQSVIMTKATSIAKLYRHLHPSN